MDPLIIASQRSPIVFFMTRSDVFNKYTNPLLWSVHMLPIYRQRDGVDTKEKNAKIFEKTNEVLKSKRNILIFGEGFTDDRIQRRLHPIKKGAARIGFSALEYCDWNEDIYLQGLGVNYTDFNQRGSDVLIAAGSEIKLNDFKEAYIDNPSKTITEVTRLLEVNMRTLVTDVHDPFWADVHEDIMMFTRKGLHPICFNNELSIEARWLYSKKLGDWLNSCNSEELDQLIPLTNKIQEYKKKLLSQGITENERYLFMNKQWNVPGTLFKMVLIAPMALLGFIHAGLPYYLTKNWVEKKFKRSVFWGSTKKVLVLFLTIFLNLPLLLIIPRFLPFDFLVNVVIGCVYFLLIGLYAQAFLILRKYIKHCLRWNSLKQINLEPLHQLHKLILDEINQRIPVQ